MTIYVLNKFKDKLINNLQLCGFIRLDILIYFYINIYYINTLLY